MKENRRYRIGFFTPNLTPSYFWHQWYITNEIARSMNIHLFTFTPFIFSHDRRSKSDFFKSFELAASENTDGLIFSTGTLRHFYDLDKLNEFALSLDMPVISIAEPLRDSHSILVDNKTGMSNLIRHFIKDHGYRDIVFLRGPENNKEAESRYAAYKEVLAENNMEFRKEYVWNGDFTYHSGQYAAEELIDARKLSFDAVIGANDSMAYGFFLELQKRDFLIPEEVAVGGFDNIEVVQNLDPPMTTVASPFSSQIRQAFKNIIDIVEGQPVERITLLPAEIIHRQSCGCSKAELPISPDDEILTPASLAPLKNFDVLKFRDSIGFFAAFTGVITIDHEGIKESLNSLFTDLEIPSFFVSFYNNGSPIFLEAETPLPKRSECYLAYYNGKNLLVPGKKYEFDTLELFPRQDFFEEKSQSFICSEIQFEHEHYGFFVADVSSADSLLILLLKVQLSSFFHSIMVQTKLETANDKLKEADQAKTRFFMNISHEIRTPLTLLLAPLESIMRGEFGEAINREDELFTSMYANASRLFSLISNLLDFSRIEAGRMVLNRKKISIPKLLSFYVNALDSTAKSKGLNFHFEDYSAVEIFSAVDQALLEQAIFNLLSNAFKFTPKNGKVILSLDRNESHFFIKVKDTGIGIPGDKIKIIFDRFTQADDSISRKYGGTGIGLAFAMEIVNLHGGNIEVESVEHRGSSFTIELPFDEQGAAAGTEELSGKTNQMLIAMQRGSLDDVVEQSIPIPEQTTPVETLGTVLVVEDNRDMRRFIRTLMEKDYKVYTANNGKLGYEVVKKNIPDLIISDIMMPEMDGYTFTKLLKKDPALQNIPIILLSAKSELLEKVEGFESGADDYLTKPFHPLEMLARVATHMKMKAYREEKTAALKAINRELAETISDLEGTQKQLIESEKMSALGGLVAGVAHEINTPVGVSVTAASHLRQLASEISELYNNGNMKRSDLENFFETLDSAAGMILNNLERADSLIRSFKQMAVDQSVEELREFKLKKYIVEIFVSLFPELKKRKHTVEVNCPEELSIKNYPGAFSQVLTNLVMNSIIHGYDSIKEGKIVCDVTLKAGIATLKYSDFGRGIDEEHLAKIFTPFFTTRRNQGGTGLGMHLVYNLVTVKMGGSIKCISKVGEGTTFIITLPLWIEDTR